MLTFVAALAIGLVLTPARQQLKSRWLWLGGLLAALIVLPNLIWQWQNGWPSLEFYAIADLQKNVSTPPVEVFLNQMLVMNPVTLPIWLAGLGYYLFVPAARPVRLLGISYVILLGLLMAAQSSRPDRIAGAYPMLLAAGAVTLQEISRRFVARRWARGLAYTGIALLLAVSVVFLLVSLPLALPTLTARVAVAVGAAQEIEQGKGGALPQYLADRLDWPALVDTVATIYNGLSPAEQAQAVIFTSNYGQAGAIDFLGRAAGLPPAISGHNQYFLWGPGAATGEVVIGVGEAIAARQELFAEIEQVATFQCTYCIENSTPIYLAKGLKIPISTFWDQTKHYD
ncbi:MAG: hypothetical protein M3Q45_09735, partial [Chloroflexota bacterium]|nr:hypothetical protein [Chloroflexota bacterium]